MTAEITSDIRTVVWDFDGTLLDSFSINDKGKGGGGGGYDGRSGLVNRFPGSENTWEVLGQRDADGQGGWISQKHRKESY